MRLVLLVLSAAVVALLCEAAAATGPTALRAGGDVTHVVDGDTIDVQLTTGVDERVRLIGIDTPERGVCGSARATAYARSLASGRHVTLVGDPTQARRDRYGRLLAYVWIDGHDLGFQQLARGLARVYIYDRPFQRLAAYRRAEREGRTRSNNIWKACGKSTPRPLVGGGRSGCDPSYPTVCIPPPPPDLDCADIPYKDFAVVGSDPHHFDGDGDGIGCEQ
jgi:micrococcal nuclease